MKKNAWIEMLLFIAILLFSIKPVGNYDFWFHITYGEYIAKEQKLPFTDMFSHTAYGQAAVPYEWLFQVAISVLFHTFGSVGVQFLVAFFVFWYFFLFRQMLLEIFHVSLLPRVLLAIILFWVGFDFWVARPQIAAYTLFMFVLYLVLKRVVLNKNWLWASIPIFWVWTNLHASMILGLYLFFSFIPVALVKKDKTLTKNLLFFGLVNTLVTILPPLSTKVYQLLFLFFDKREFIQQAITEWAPLTYATNFFVLYITLIVLAFCSLLFVFFKKRQGVSLVFFIPLIPLGLFILSGMRQSLFSLPATLLLFVPFTQTIEHKWKPYVHTICAIFILCLGAIGIYIYKQRTNINPVYPTHVISFIKNNLKGNMFNEYTWGGYLMYTLGPTQKTFIDGRTDMFLPRVLPQYIAFTHLAYVSDEEYLAQFHRLLEPYDVSWAILSTERFSLSWRLGRALEASANWQLVYFDDESQIYVRNDGKNTDTLKTFAFLGATPFSKTLYRPGARDRARKEYQEMNDRQPSGVANNALGFMLLEDENFSEAEGYFKKALEIYPTAAAPKMNLAELAASEGRLAEAVGLYKEALLDDPGRGIAYLRLGQLIIESEGSKQEARSVWKKGLTMTADSEVLEKLQKELSQF